MMLYLNTIIYNVFTSTCTCMSVFHIPALCLFTYEHDFAFLFLKMRQHMMSYIYVCVHVFFIYEGCNKIISFTTIHKQVGNRGNSPRHHPGD